jgi:hypothetical protein
MAMMVRWNDSELLYQPTLDDFSQRGFLSYHHNQNQHTNNSKNDIAATVIEWDASRLRAYLTTSIGNNVGRHHHRQQQQKPPTDPFGP